MLQHEARCLHERSAARHLVIDDQRHFSLDVTDQVDRPRRLVVAVAALVHDRDRQVQSSGVMADVLRFADVAGDEHVVPEIATLAQVVAQDRRGLELVGRNTEEALHLRRVQIHRQDAVGAGRLQQVGHEARRDGDARPVLLVRASVGKVRQHGGDPSRRRVLERVDRHQELDDSVRHRRARGLDHEDVRLANVFVDLDEQVLVREAHDRRTAQVGAETLANVPGQLRMRRAADHLDRADHAPSPVSERLIGATFQSLDDFVHSQP